MKPFYQDSAVTIYLGDCLEILPQINEKYCEVAAKRMAQEVLSFNATVEVPHETRVPAPDRPR